MWQFLKFPECFHEHNHLKAFKHQHEVATLSAYCLCKSNNINLHPNNITLNPIVIKMGLWKSIIICLHNIESSSLQVSQHGLTAPLPNDRPAPQPTPSHTWIKVSDMIIREARWCRWREHRDRGDRSADMMNRRSVVKIIGRGFLNDANSHLRYRTHFF